MAGGAIGVAGKASGVERYLARSAGNDTGLAGSIEVVRIQTSAAEIEGNASEAVRRVVGGVARRADLRRVDGIVC